MIDAGFPKIRFSTADLPERNRVPIWREYYGHTIFKVEVEPACDASFRATVHSRALPELHLLSGALTAVRITRAREFLADGENDLAVVINRAGRFTVAARGREVALNEGDAVLVSSGEVFRFDRSTRGSSFSIRIPYSVLSSLVVDIDDLIARPIPQCTGALRLLTTYAAPLLEDDALVASEVRRLAVTHIHDLVALTLGATRDAADAAQNRGVRAARLRAAKTYIAANSDDASLSIGAVAKHLGVTPRYLQKLFECDGSTFSSFLLGQRLARAHRTLTNPRFDSCHVSTIAYEAGFGDLSHFNRCFRQRYGATPRDIRVSAKRPAGSSQPCAASGRDCG